MKEPCNKCGKLVLKETKIKTGGFCVPCIREVYPFWPNKNSPKPADPLSKEIPGNLHHRIKAIIDREILEGNEVSGVGTWPRPKSIYMEHKFKLAHDEPGVTYVENHDPHYLIAMYVEPESGDTVLCSIF